MGREKVFKVRTEQCSGNDPSSEPPLGLFSMMVEAGTVLPLDLRKAICEATEFLGPMALWMPKHSAHINS